MGCNNLTMEPETSRSTLMQEQKQSRFQEFWSQHRTTLISYQTQYVQATKPEPSHDPEEGKKAKAKKKNNQYEGGFLFPGRPGAKDESILQLIEGSKFNHLKELFCSRRNLPKEMLKLREFVKIMLELKHSSILNQFLQIYDLIIKEIKEVKLESIRAQKDRFCLIDEIAAKLVGFVLNCPYLFPQFTKYMKDNRKETTQLFRVTTYCFIAEKYCFNINQFYAQAFDCAEEESKMPKKKNKLSGT